jgi:hypothetical protein
MKLKFINQTRGRGTWKFNNGLLTDTEFVNKVKQKIKVQAFPKKWWVESGFKAPNLPLSLRFQGSGCHCNSI